MTTTLGPGDVHVWCRRADEVGDGELAEALALLSPEERERCGRFVFDRDRRTFAIAHALLRISLSRYAAVAPLAWRFREAPGGKPFIAQDEGTPALSFNLSHTDGLTACAIAWDQPVGVDVECTTRPIGDGVARRFFAPVEIEALRRLPAAAQRTRRFFELWTLKEAYVKAIGAGLAHPLNTITFTPDGADAGAIGFELPPEVDASRWRFALFHPSDHHVLAVAVDGGRGGPGSITLEGV